MIPSSTKSAPIQTATNHQAEFVPQTRFHSFRSAHVNQYPLIERPLFSHRLRPISWTDRSHNQPLPPLSRRQHPHQTSAFNDTKKEFRLGAGLHQSLAESRAHAYSSITEPLNDNTMARRASNPISDRITSVNTPAICTLTKDTKSGSYYFINQEGFKTLADGQCYFLVTHDNPFRILCLKHSDSPKNFCAHSIMADHQSVLTAGNIDFKQGTLITWNNAAPSYLYNSTNQKKPNSANTSNNIDYLLPKDKFYSSIPLLISKNSHHKYFIETLSQEPKSPNAQNPSLQPLLSIHSHNTILNSIIETAQNIHINMYKTKSALSELKYYQPNSWLSQKLISEDFYHDLYTFNRIDPNCGTQLTAASCKALILFIEYGFIDPFKVLKAITQPLKKGSLSFIEQCATLSANSKDIAQEHAKLIITLAKNMKTPKEHIIILLLGCNHIRNNQPESNHLMLNYFFKRMIKFNGETLPKTTGGYYFELINHKHNTSDQNLLQHQAYKLLKEHEIWPTTDLVGKIVKKEYGSIINNKVSDYENALDSDKSTTLHAVSMSSAFKYVDEISELLQEVQIEQSAYRNYIKFKSFGSTLVIDNSKKP